MQAHSSARGLRLNDWQSTDVSRTKGSRIVSCQAVLTHNYEVHRPLSYSAAVSVLNVTLVPSSNDVSKRRQQKVSLVSLCFFINRFLSFKLWKVTSVQTWRIWRCHAVVLLIHQTSTQLLEWYRDPGSRVICCCRLVPWHKQMNAWQYLWFYESEWYTHQERVIDNNLCLYRHGTRQDPCMYVALTYLTAIHWQYIHMYQHSRIQELITSLIELRKEPNA